MAIAFLPLNGVGLGHLVRTTVLCEALRTVDERPVIFSQGVFPLDDRCDLPGRRVPSLWTASDRERAAVGDDIRSMIEISLPAVLVEDTHPSAVRLPSRIRRVLAVRPTTFAYLERLQREYRRVYAAFLLCDAPGSPTWPYSQAQTRAIASWRQWHSIGPVFRKAAPADMATMRDKYRVGDGTRLLVCTMGGGGMHRESDADARAFAALAARTLGELRERDPGTRGIFVKGPHFARDVSCDPTFEVVEHEPRMASLLAIARAAVVRTGFNTTWECVAAGTPFLAYPGTTFHEPGTERLASLRAWGLLNDDLDVVWGDDAWRASFAAACARALLRWSGTPRSDVLQALVNGPRQHGAAMPRPAAPRSQGVTSALRRRVVRAAYAGDVPLLIRIDDVVSLEPALDWLLAFLAQRRMHASLEVVPYLCRLDDRALDRYARDGLFAVGQHGYAHVPRRGPTGGRFEFDPASSAPDLRSLHEIAEGKRIVEAAFPRRFAGGFSPPFDAMPPWLPQAWQQAGGAFVTCLSRRAPATHGIPVLDAGRDLYDWSAGRQRSVREITDAIDDQARARGYAGLALHPRCLRSHVERRELARVIDLLRARGLASAPIATLALKGPMTRREPPPVLRALGRWALR